MKATKRETLSQIIERDGRRPVDISAAAGYSPRYLYSLLKDRRFNPRPWRLAQLASVLGVSVDRLRAAIAAERESR